MQASVNAQLRPARQCAPASCQLRSPKYRWSSVVRASATVSSPQTSESCSSAYARVKDVALIRCSDGERVPVGSLWGESDRAVVAFARTFGCPFCWELATQLRRDIKPQLDQQGIKLFLVAIGTHERSKDFIAATGFPAECLLADPDSSAYKALGLVKGVSQTFFDINTPLSLLQRLTSGSTEDLKDILPRWKPWQPPKLDQALQQGGMFIFEGSNCVWCHYDKATAAHTDLEEVVKLATAADCGCAA